MNMNKSIILFFSILSFIPCFGQTKYEPQILILSPNEMTYDKVFEKEISNANKEIKKGFKKVSKESKSGELDNQPENIKTMMQDEISFSKTLDFSKEATIMSEQYLAYRFYEKFQNLLITMKDIKCNGNITSLKRISEEQHLQYVLNFPKIELYKQSGISYAKVKVQLYDYLVDEILLDKDYIGDWSNPGFEFSCQDSSINCTISNALSQALADVIKIVAANSPTLRKQNDLAQQRFNILIRDYYSNKFDSLFLNKIIPSNDTNIDLKIIYQCLLDESKTKFIAFFLEKSPPHDFKSMKDDRKDMHVNIISSKDIKDSGFLDDIPQTYAYIVEGVKYSDKWYYQKANVTYFEATTLEEGRQFYFNNLQQWNFFKVNSTEFNPDFWETNRFDKVKDLTKDPDWDKYGENIWKDEERDNRDFIGMYAIVANKLKILKEEEEKNNLKQISDSIFKPFFETQKKINPSEFKDYNLIHNEFILIFPREKNFILNPIQIVNDKGEKAIRYFIFIKQTGNILEWNYFKENPFNENKIKDVIYHYGSIVMAQINTLTKWDFSFKTLDDTTFWDKYVLLKTGEEYKYLRGLK